MRAPLKRPIRARVAWGNPPPSLSRPHLGRSLAAATGALLACGAVGASTGMAAPPSPCNGAAQITDASGDGHHSGTDVLGAWFSEASGRLQAVVQVRAGLWVAEHDDAEVDGGGYAFIFTTGGRTSYVRISTPGPDTPQNPIVYDYGTYTAPAGFASTGATTGTVEPGASGTATIDIPAATGAVAGATLTNVHVITYDGITGGTPDWVDHAPGATDPLDSGRGADYVVGSCTAAPPPPGTSPAVTGVELNAPSRVTGRKTVTVSGRVVPARAGVAVTLTRRTRGSVTSQLTSAADGTFRARVAIGETTRLRAVAGGIGSRELTVTARSKVRIKVTRRRDGSALITGTVDPKLPGRVLWLRTNAVSPSARTTTRSGTFRLRIKHPRRGRYQAVVIPSGNRAERATSNTGVIR